MFLKISKKLLRFCFYSIASIIITLAVAMAVMRVLLPDLGGYREDIQRFVSKHMGYPVEIEEIQARWVGWIPNLDLKNISVLDANTMKPIVHFDSAHVKFDLLASVDQRTLVPSHVMISGTELTFARQIDGSIIIVESGTNLSNKDSGDQTLTDWFKLQNNIIIYDATLSWIDQQNNKPPVYFKNTFIELSSNEEQITASGTVDLEQTNGKAELDFAIDIYGDINTNDWSGTMNVNANNLDIAPWLDNESLFGLKIGSQQCNSQIKSKFKQAKLNQLVANIQYDELILGEGDSAIQFNDLTADLDLLRKEDEKWIIDLTLDETTSEENPLPKISIRVETQTDKEQDFYVVDAHINRLPLKKIIAIAKQIPEMNDMVSSYPISDGAFNNVDVQYQSRKTDTNYNVENSETLEELNKQTKHDLKIKADDFVLVLPEYYEHPLSFTNLDTQFSWLKENDGINFLIENFTLQTPDFPVTFEGQFKTDNENQDTLIKLLLNVEQVALNKVPDYLPKTTNLILKKWLTLRLIGGHANNSELFIEGSLAKFPFKNNQEGIFKLTTDINNASLNYQDGWPILEKAFGKLTLEGTELKIVVDNGKILSADVKDVTALIPDTLADFHMLTIKGQVNTQGPALAIFIDKSPLKERKSLQTIEEINLKGPIHLDLDLLVPLYPEDFTTVNGTLNFVDNNIDSELLQMKLDEFKGDIIFTRETVISEGLTARYFDQIVNLEIPQTTANETEYVLIKGDMDKDFIKQQLEYYMPDEVETLTPYLEHVTGTSTWQAKFNLDGEDTGNEVVLVSSDLHGIEIDLPKPLYKEELELLPLNLAIPLSDSPQKNMVIELENLLTARFDYTTTDETTLNSLLVDFGTVSQQTTQANGIMLKGKINELDLAGWLDLQEIDTNKQITDRSSIYNNVFAELELGNLFFLDQQFKNVKTTVKQHQGNWDIVLNSEDIEGIISMPYDLNSVDLNLSHLVINNNGDYSESLKTDPDDLPALKIFIKDFKYNNKLLGELQLSTSKFLNGVSFDEIKITTERMNITGQGEWTKISGQNHSSLDFKLNADSINDVLETFNDQTSSIEDGKIELTLTANWDGSPGEFQLQNLNGDLRMSIEDGNILDIDPKAGRLFGLLSIQSIPRRLSLDFSDLFGKGLKFDSIKGSFSITQGQTYTNDLVMVGPSASIAISGRTGLVDRDYDQIVTVTPQISDSLPVAGALFGPVGIGVGAVIYFAGEIFDSIPENIDKLLQIKYTITGSWDDPIVEKYKYPENNSQEDKTENGSGISKAIKK